MGYKETIWILHKMKDDQNTYNPLHCNYIIDAIMNYYMVTTNFYFEDCIKVFDRFLNTGVLSFER